MLERGVVRSSIPNGNVNPGDPQPHPGITQRRGPRTFLLTLQREARVLKMRFVYDLYSNSAAQPGAADG